MNARIVIIYGALLSLLWNTEDAQAVLLTSTLITGLMGGFLIGRMNLGTFLSLLSNNGTPPSLSLPSILPSLASLIPREEQKAAANSIPVSSTIIPQAPAIPTNVMYQQVPVPYYYYAGGGGAFPFQQQPIPVASVESVATTKSPKVDFSIIPMKPMNVPVSLDNKIRERFIRQLTLIDPLNCLPKIFCEVSADPYGTVMAIDHGTIAAIQPSSNHASIGLEEMEAYEMHLHKQTTTTTPKPTTISTTASTATDDVQSDTGDSDEDDDSGSDEIDSDEEDDSFEQYRKEEEDKLEMQALEEMVEEVEDPMSYYFILQDKKRRKEKRKKNKEKHKNREDGGIYEEPSVRQDELTFLPDDSGGQGHTFNYGDPSLYVNRRFSSEPPRPPMAPPQPPRPSLFMPSMMMEPTEPPLSDMFADDPFFDEFPSSSSRRMRQLSGNEDKVIAHRRKSRNTKTDLMKNYRVAYKVAEKYRSPDMCRSVFPSCPYQTKTILSVVNRLESGLLPFELGAGESYRPNRNKKNNINHFKNTLIAIERLNKATFQAHARGEPLNLEKVTEAASSPSIKIEANTSKNIIKEFQQVVSKIKTAKLKEMKKKKKKNKKRKNYDAVHYYKKAQMEALKPKERIQPNPLQIHQLKKAEDDEPQISRRKWEQVPTFKETYSHMFTVSKVKPKPTSPPPFTTTKRPKMKFGTSNASVSTIKPIKKFSEATEDDEKEAKDSEDAINSMISQVKSNRSPIV